MEYSNGNRKSVTDIQLSIQTQPMSIHIGIHGFWGSGADFTSLQNHLSFPLSTIDLLGFGKSPVSKNIEDYSVDSQCELLNNQLPPCHIISYSMGARLALQYTVQFPHKVKSLICIGVNPGIENPIDREQRKQWDKAWANRFSQREKMHQNIKTWSNIPLLKSLSQTASWNEIKKRRAQQSHIGLQNSILGFGTGTMPSCWKRLTSIKTPTLLMHGELDTKYMSIHQRMKKFNGKFTLEQIPMVGHAPHIEAPQRAAEVIQNWYCSITQQVN